MQKLGSMQNYILMYGRFTKNEPLIALGSHQGGSGGWEESLNFCVCVIPPQVTAT